MMTVASKVKCKQVLSSYGIETELTYFLTELESVQRQICNKFSYEKSMSRVRYSIHLKSSVLFFWAWENHLVRLDRNKELPLPGKEKLSKRKMHR